MTHIIEDRVMELSTSAGTGNFNLAGAAPGFRTFASVCIVGDTVPYYIEAIGSTGLPTGDYEYGLGTYSAANVLTRTTVRGSSNAGAAVPFAAGTKIVAVGIAAPVSAGAKKEWLDALGVYMDSPNFPNASCQVAQRLAAVAFSGARTIGRVDNVKLWASGGAVSAGTNDQVTTSPAGTSGYAVAALGVTLTGAGVISAAINMGAADAVKFKGKTASVQAKVYHDAGVPVNYRLLVSKPTTVDGFATRTTINTSAAIAVPSASGTLITFVGVALGDVSNGLELEIQAVCGAIVTKNFHFTEFAVTPGIGVMQWGGKDYHIELAACRNLLRFVNNRGWVGQATSTSTIQIVAEISPPMRVAPTVTLLDTTPAVRQAGVGYTAAAATLLSQNNTPNAYDIGISGFPALTNGGIVTGNKSNDSLMFSCEFP